jgi:hypothetical protein
MVKTTTMSEGCCFDAESGAAETATCLTDSTCEPQLRNVRIAMNDQATIWDRRLTVEYNEALDRADSN